MNFIASFTFRTHSEEVFFFCCGCFHYFPIGTVTENVINGMDEISRSKMCIARNCRKTIDFHTLNPDCFFYVKGPPMVEASGNRGVIISLSSSDRLPLEDAGKRLVLCDSANLQTTRPWRPFQAKISQCMLNMGEARYPQINRFLYRSVSFVNY